MPGALDSLSRAVRSDHRGHLFHFLQARQGEWPSASDTAAHNVFLPHRSIRPAEFMIQDRLGIHPGLEHLCRWYEEAAREFGSDVHQLALLDWTDLLLQRRPSSTIVGEILEAWCLDRPVDQTRDVLDSVGREAVTRMADDGVRAVSAMATSAILLLANESFGPPSTDLLELASRRFEVLAEFTHGTLPTNAIALGSLMWRALDYGVRDEATLHSLVHKRPDLLRVLDTHLVLGTVRVSASVPFNSPTERFLEHLCLERLDSIPDSPGVHTPNGPIKIVPLWPGKAIFLRALAHLEDVRTVIRDEYQNTFASSLWHILRHSRPRPTEVLTANDLRDVSERTISMAAMVAPWWAPQLEAAARIHGLTDLTAWTHAHARSALGNSDAMPNMPRIEAQIEAVTRDRGVRSQEERDDGVLERQWFLDAAERLGPERTRTVIGFMPMAFRHATHLGDAALAVLGENREAIWAAARKHSKNGLRMLGALPPATKDDWGDTAARFELLRNRWADLEAVRQPHKRQLERQVVHTGAKNLGESVGIDDPTLLAWKVGEAAVESVTFPLPVELPKYTLVATRDDDGDPSLGVIKRGQNTRLLKTVPRNVVARPEFKAARTGLNELRSFVGRLTALFDRRLIYGATLAATDLVRLVQHPVASIVLPGLIFIDDEDAEGFAQLNADRVQLQLVGHDASVRPVRREATVRVAHPLELHRRQSLGAWRDAVFAQRVSQPFPQVFRAFTPSTGAAKASVNNEPSGHMVVVAKAVTALTSLGWEVRPGQAPRRVLRGADLAAQWSLGGDSPEGIFSSRLVETGPLHFTQLRTGQAMGVRDVPPDVLSELLRDVGQTVIMAGQNDRPLPASFLAAREALARAFGVDAMRKMHFDIPVSTTVSASRLTARVDLPATRRSAAVHVDLNTAAVSVEGTDVVPHLPPLREPVFVPHPMDGPLRRALEVFMCVLQALEIEDRSIMGVLERL